MIDATELFDRADRAFRSLREKAEGRDVTPEWARLHAKGTAMANANEIFKAKLSDVDEADVHTVIKDIDDTLDALITAAKDAIAEVEADATDKVTEFRNAIADGHADGYKIARDYLKQEVVYFRNV